MTKSYSKSLEPHQNIEYKRELKAMVGQKVKVGFNTHSSSETHSDTQICLVDKELH